MGDSCILFLAKSAYTPGETITGRVRCHFQSENDVRNIDLRFKGKAKVYWKRGKTHYKEEEIYFDMESPLLQGRTTFPPGDYEYPFSFNLKLDIPATAVGKYGEIKYTALAKVDLPFAPDYKSEVVFTVLSSSESFDKDHYEQPFQVIENHCPMWGLFSKDPIRLVVNMRKRNYIASEMVVFSAELENFTSMNIKEVRFKLVQGFVYYACDNEITSDEWVGQEFAIIDSIVPSNSKKSWDLELRIPPNAYTGNLSFCKIMKAVWELQGEVQLPFPYSNFKVKIPLQVRDAVPQ